METDTPWRFSRFERETRYYEGRGQSPRRQEHRG